jgi:hypothetical protein
MAESAFEVVEEVKFRGRFDGTDGTARVFIRRVFIFSSRKCVTK